MVINDEKSRHLLESRIYKMEVQNKKAVGELQMKLDKALKELNKPQKN